MYCTNLIPLGYCPNNVHFLALTMSLFLQFINLARNIKSMLFHLNFNNSIVAVKTHDLTRYLCYSILYGLRVEGKFNERGCNFEIKFTI